MHTLRNIAILLGFSLLTMAPAWLTYGWLHHQREQVRHEVKWHMMEGIPASQLTRLAFTPAEAQTLLRWKHSQEFEYRQQMYDVVKVKHTADSIVYWCWWDHAETQLNQQLNHLVANALGHSPERTAHTQQLEQFWQHLFAPPSSVPTLPAASALRIPDRSLSAANQFVSPPIAPPPQA